MATCHVCPPDDQHAALVRHLQATVKHLTAEIIASSSLLDKPFTNAPDQSPWTRIAYRLNQLRNVADAIETALTPKPDDQHVPDHDMLDHLRVIHPDLYGDGPETWPDGTVVIHDTTLEPRDFGTDHRPVEGSDFMFPEWCGACDACGPAPTICAACSYDEHGPLPAPVLWPCKHVPDHDMEAL